MSSLSGCSTLTGDDPVSESQEQLRRGNYYLAYSLLQDADPSVRKTPAYRSAQLAYVLAHGQELVFANRESEGLAEFHRALELDPGNAVALAWIDKTNRKLAAREVDKGDDYRLSGELEDALRSYRMAESYVPDYPPALEGAQQVADIVRQKKQRAQDQYIAGVDALGEHLYGVAWYHMVNAVEIDPGLDAAAEKRDYAAGRLQQDRYKEATELESSGHYGAALTIYRELQSLGADMGDLQERIDRTQKEVDASRLVEEAEGAVFRDKFDEARDLLERAYDLTTSEKARVSDLLIMVRERSLEQRYHDARLAEVEYRFPDALSIYRSIDEQWDGFKDVKARISDLESSIQVANDAYQRGQSAEKAGDLEAAISAYQEALLVWPGFKDLGQKVVALQKQQQGQLQPQPGQEQPAQEQPAPQPPASQQEPPAPTEQSQPSSSQPPPSTESPPPSEEGTSGGSPNGDGTPNRPGDPSSPRQP